ncbi:GNAT family N-acetyltransferase [Lederbergia citrea]|uniref:GNAT family N-acetyltransferase n=1 Tax=Lederbergia citrea TaxID=2833581 RepID=UPI001BC9221F|nr:GNAT family N-acetyltransferase [Lederbergia citrea]MBS4177247.1 GNAT family N-acetyltransferase [Lederbergia citrea]
MNVIKLTQEYFREAIEMSMYAFQYELSQEQIDERLKSMKSQNILGIIEGEKLAAKLYILPFKIIQNGKEFNMGGVAGVATYPEFRRRGYVKELLNKALEDMKEKGQVISMLSPFYIDFYRKYGWELFVEYQLISLEKEDLINRSGESYGWIKRYKKGEFYEDLNTVYEKFSLNYSGMLVRSEEWWKKSVLNNFSPAIYFSDDGHPQGYILYKIENRKMEVKEFIVLNHQARLALWRFICQHDSMLDKLEIRLPMNEQLPFILKNPNVKREVKPYFMARIVDVEKYLQAYPFINPGTKSVIFKVIDEHAPWNEGKYVITTSGVTKIADGSDNENQPYLVLSINSLTALLLGYMNAIQLWEIRAIQGNLELVECLHSMIPKQTPYFLDTF